MAAEFYYCDAGAAWRKAKELWLRDAGTWRKAKEVWYRDGGVWRKVFSGFTAASNNFLCSLTTNYAASIEFQVDGTVLLGADGGGTVAGSNWGAPTTAGAGVDFWIRATVTSGSLSSGTAGAWLQLSAARGWTKSPPSPGLSTSVLCSYQIASDSAGTNVVASGTFRLTVDLT